MRIVCFTQIRLDICMYIKDEKNKIKSYICVSEMNIQRQKGLLQLFALKMTVPTTRQQGGQIQM